MMVEKQASSKGKKKCSYSIEFIKEVVIYAEVNSNRFLPYILMWNCKRMEEKLVWNDMVSNTTVEKTGSKEVPMKSTGHDKVHVSICLTGKVDGTRLKPFILFKGAKQESIIFIYIHNEFSRKCSVSSSTNKWMNEELM